MLLRQSQSSTRTCPAGRMAFNFEGPASLPKRRLPMSSTLLSRCLRYAIVFTNSSPPFNFLVDPSAALWYCKHSRPGNYIRKQHHPSIFFCFFLLKWSTENQICWNSKPKGKSVPCTTDEIESHHADWQPIPFLPLKCQPSSTQAKKVSSHSNFLGRSQDIVPTPEQQCLCRHIASHVTLTCMCYGLRSLISPALRQLMIWEGDNTPWKAHNPQSVESALLFFLLLKVLTFLWNVEDNHNSFALPPKKAYLSWSDKWSEERDDNPRNTDVQTYTVTWGMDSQWYIDPWVSLLSSFPSHCIPKRMWWRH